MSKRNQHVLPLGNGWAIQSEGANRVTYITIKQSDAIIEARNIAKKNSTALIVHGRDGKIRKRINYSSI